MRVLVVGGGGREHALAWKLSQEAEVLAAPGNPGIAEDCETVQIPVSDHDGLLATCRSNGIELAVIGPEDPLVAGLADKLRAAGVPTYGPGAAGAQLEGSKAFSKAMMSKADVPTAAYQTFSDPEPAREFARQRFGHGRGVAVKASGNALGKGVVIAETEEEAEEAIDRMMVAREFGDAGAEVVIEDRLMGREFSLLTIVGDQNYVSLPVAQDYKRALTGDLGPNTGGVGAYSPVDWVPSGMVEEVERMMVAPIVEQLRKEGIPFRGTLFSGVLVEDGKPYCLEYNVRFGDPEMQTIALRLGDGFLNALYGSATGERVEAPAILPNAAIAIVICSRGYPGRFRKGLPITIGDLPQGVKLFHAGTSQNDGQLVTNGGRVVCVSASGFDSVSARTLAYRGAAFVRFEDSYHRTDVG